MVETPHPTSRQQGTIFEGGPFRAAPRTETLSQKKSPEKLTPRPEGRGMSVSWVLCRTRFGTILTDPKTRTGSGFMAKRETSKTNGRDGPWDVEVDGAAYGSVCAGID